MASNQKPSVDPAVLKIAMVLAGVACLIAAAFVPPDYRVEVVAAGAGLLGWAKRAPGDISLTSNVDDVQR
jgi:hypothetical protein